MGFHRNRSTGLDLVSADQGTYGYYADFPTVDVFVRSALPGIARQLFPDLSEAEQLRIIDGCCQAEHEALLKKCAPLYEGLEHTLQELGKKYPLFIVSNCQAGYIEVFLKATGFGHYFKGHLCPGDTGLAKAANIRKIARDL